MSTQVTISARVPAALRQQLDELATATQRDRSWLIEAALRRYIEEQAWQVQAIQEALADYRAGTADLVPHDEVDAAMAALEAQLSATAEQ